MPGRRRVRRRAATPEEPATHDEAAATHNEGAATHHELAATHHERAATPDEPTATPDERAATPDERAATPDEAAATHKETAPTPASVPKHPSRKRPAESRDQAERGLRSIVGNTGFQVDVSAAMRARDVARSRAEDEAAAERDLTIVRRHYIPPDKQD